MSRSSIPVLMLRYDELPERIRRSSALDEGLPVESEGMFYLRCGEEVISCEASPEGERMIRALLDGRAAADDIPHRPDCGQYSECRDRRSSLRFYLKTLGQR